MPSGLTRLAARAVRATYLIDRAYRRFDRLRSAAVLRLAREAFYDAYNGVAYSKTPSYDPSSASFRSALFDWEERAIAAWFPAPPARVLICGAGGGREAAVLARRGYQVTAFDPAEPLVRAFAASEPGRLIDVYRGAYGTLPVVWKTSGEPVDLSAGVRFDAAVLGWSSLSHLRGDQACVDALRAVAGLTAGPMLASYFSRDDQPGGGTKEVFSITIGYYRQFSADEVRDLAARAGLRLLHHENGAPWPFMILASG